MTTPIPPVEEARVIPFIKIRIRKDGPSSKQEKLKIEKKYPSLTPFKNRALSWADSITKTSPVIYHPSPTIEARYTFFLLNLYKDVIRKMPKGQSFKDLIKDRADVQNTRYLLKITEVRPATNWFTRLFKVFLPKTWWRQSIGELLPCDFSRQTPSHFLTDLHTNSGGQ
jgi:hypothetical protein